MGNVIRQVDLCEHSDRAKNDPKEVRIPLWIIYMS